MRYPVRCDKFESLAVLYALGEMEAPLRAAVEEHARACPHCAVALRRETALAGIFSSSHGAAEQEPSDLLLARCRGRLSGTLDSAAAGPPRFWDSLFSLRDWIAAFRVSPRIHPAWSFAALILIGAFAGLAGWQGIGRAPLQQLGPATMTVLAAPPPPPVAAVPEEATLKPAPREQLPAQPALNDLHVYSATDAGMNDSRREAGGVGERAQQQAALALGFDASTSQARRNAPPPTLPPSAAWDAPERGRLARLSRRMEALWWGGVRVQPAEQQKRLIQAPAPEYPEVARRAGIEGQVTLLLRVGEDGAVQNTQLLSGAPVLGRAAAEAVEQWRYSPLRIGGRPVSTLTSVTFDFRLR